MALVEIEIPPRPEFVGVVRLALGALARSASLEEETLDDLRIAVSEACANAVVSSEEAGSESPITVGWDADEARIVVDVSDPAPAPDGETGTRLDLSMKLLESLVDGLDVEPLSTGGHITRLTITRSPSSS